MAGIRLLGPVTREALLAGLYDGLRLAAIVICIGAANSLANPKRLLKSVPPALYEIGTTLVVAVTVFPQLADSARRVRAAQALRTTGFGRTGTMFASEQCALAPDLMAIGKGITGGYLAMAATVANRRVYDAFLGEDLGERTLYHGHSYSGNALASAVGLAHLELFESLDVLPNVTARAAQLDELLMTRVAPLPGVAAVRQHGLMVGIELDPPDGATRWGRKVTAESVRRGVLIRPLGDVVVLMPILTTTAEEIERIVEVLVGSIVAVHAAEPADAPADGPDGG